MTIDYVVSCYLEKMSMTILDSTFQEHFKFPSFCNLHIVADFFSNFVSDGIFLARKVYYKINWLLQICLINDLKK